MSDVQLFKPAPQALPSWPEDRVLRLRGRIPTRELDLGPGSLRYESNRLWSFTYPFPVSIPREFRAHSKYIAMADGRSMLVGVEREGIYVLPNPDNLDVNVPFFSYVDEHKQLVNFVPQKNAIFQFGEAATLCMQNTPRIDIIAECVKGDGRPTSINVPQVTWRNLTKEQDVSRALSTEDVPRGLAACVDLPESIFERLISCPDPITRALLVKNPCLPARFFSWAISYPSILVTNPGLLAIARNAIKAYGNPLASATPEARAKIMEIVDRAG